LLRPLKDSVDKLLVHSMETINANEQARHLKIIKSLAPFDFGAKYTDILSRRQVGTGTWFLEHATFQSWKCELGACLWCPGIPGAGKTTMMAIAIDHLCEQVQQDLGSVVIYAFCDYRERTSQTVTSMLMSFWRQLVRKRVLTSSECNSLESAYQGRDFHITTEEASELLKVEICRYKHVYLLLDALDEFELEQRANLIDALRRLANNVTLLITSRYLEDDLLGHSGPNTLEITAVEADISRYISGRLKSERRLQQNCLKDSALESSIADVLVRKTRGM
jgi:hypothetical protein